MVQGILRQVVAQQADDGRVARDVGAAAQGDADVAGGQGRGVVHAVAHHRHRPESLCASADGRDLLVGQELGLDGDAQLAGDRLPPAR